MNNSNPPINQNKSLAKNKKRQKIQSLKVNFSVFHKEILTYVVIFSKLLTYIPFYIYL